MERAPNTRTDDEPSFALFQHNARVFAFVCLTLPACLFPSVRVGVHTYMPSVCLSSFLFCVLVKPANPLPSSLFYVMCVPVLCVSAYCVCARCAPDDRPPTDLLPFGSEQHACLIACLPIFASCVCMSICLSDRKKQERKTERTTQQNRGREGWR